MEVKIPHDDCASSLLTSKAVLAINVCLALMLFQGAPARGTDFLISLTTAEIIVNGLKPEATSGSCSFSVDASVSSIYALVTTTADGVSASITAPGGEELDETSIVGFGGTFSPGHT